MRRKEQIELSAEAPMYSDAQRLSSGLLGIASIIPKEDKALHQIPSIIDARALRSAIARSSINESQNCDQKHLEIAANIIKWLQLKLEA